MPTTPEAGTRPLRLSQSGLRLLSIDLVVVDGPARGARVHVQGSTARVGSASGNHLPLGDDTVSRVHCELHVRADSVVVRDLGSTNGTFVEGVRLREGEVRPGASVRVGQSTFRIEAADGATVIPLSDKTSFGELVGGSIEMRRVYAVLERIAPTNVTLLIEGETGTGKDVAARALHGASSRADGPFIPVDCGAIPENLIESELFGHVRGAFSGTLFLDEIGEMPISVQAKLLRAIETRSVRRVGGNTERPVDVRIVAATNRSLATRANEGAFREDLYYRLAVVEVKLPPLRARPDDIAPLARHFHEKLAGGGAPMPEAFVAMLVARGWPGNVRELRNFIERSVSLGFMGDSPAGAAKARPALSTPEAALETIVPLHLPLKDARQAWTESFESIYVRCMLKKTGGNLTRAAELAGVNRRFLQRLIARLGLRQSGALALDKEDDD
jgi:DNA-binding NtrC family response regulator